MSAYGRRGNGTGRIAAAPHAASFSVDLGIAVLLFLVALGLRVLAIWASGFDGLYGQDPFAYLGYSIELKRALASGAPPPPFFWPIGYPLLVALSMTVVGEGAGAAQLVSVLTGALAAPLVYAVVRQLRPGERAGALVAGLLAASASQLMISSLSVMSDAAGLAWITLAALAVVRHERALASGAPSLRAFAWLALAALAFALATLSRWAYLLPALPFGLSTLLAWGAARIAWGRRIAAAAAALAIVVVVVGLQLVPELGSGELPHVGDLRVVGWDPRNAFRSTLANSDGIFRYERPIGVFYAAPLVHPRFIFPLLTPFVFVGAAELYRSARSSLVLFVGWPLVVYLFLAGIAWENPRFSLLAFSPLLVLVGVGFGRAAQSRRALYRRGAIVCAGLALLGSLAWCVRDVGRFTAMKHAHLEAVRWAERSTPENATIASFGLTQMLEHYTARKVANLYHLAPDGLSELTSAAAPVYVLVDPANVEDQWRGMSPARNLAWLRSHSTLTEVGRRSPWVLFRIGSRG
jgi:4-amino-4-deoxy-L-arabinose transferase-like glycosyltransferase